MRQCAASKAEGVASTRSILLRLAFWGKDAFKVLEKSLGQNYDPHSLLWDLELRKYVRPSTTLVWDWMHCVVASGGTAQYSVGAFCRDVRDAGISLVDLDTWQVEALHGNHNHSLPKDFFQKRVKPEPLSHIKAFASECLTAVAVLAMFSRMVLDARGVLSRQSRMMQILSSICDILTSGDLAIAMCDQLADLFVQHHRAMLALYGHEILKVKTHLCHHIAPCLKRLGFMVSCFSNERRNRLVKAVCDHVPGSHLSRSILTRILMDLENRVQGARFEENCLVAPISDANCIAAFLGIEGARVRCSKSIAFRRGPVRTGMVMSLTSDGTGSVRREFVLVHAGIDVTYSSIDCPMVLALCEKLVRVSDDLLRITGVHELVDPSLFASSHMFASDDGKLRLLTTSF